MSLNYCHGTGHHRDTENTELAQRRLESRQSCEELLRRHAVLVSDPVRWCTLESSNCSITMTAQNDTNGPRPLSFVLRPLMSGDAKTVSVMLTSQPPEYVRFFYAFGFDEAAIEAVLSRLKRDLFFGIFSDDLLVAIFMLRGWDAGYEVPSFGVLVDQKQRGYGYLQISLEVAKVVARISGASQLMAKIHPENMSQRGARRLGFLQTGTEVDTGNIIYHMELR
jgi:hypothetical protein